MPSESPLVSVYLVNHNYSRFIERAIESVLAQSMQDFELIIIDDGSTDNSREIIERYQQDRRITTIFQQNRGLNVTNNIALRAASGKYILRLDADDFFDPHALEILSGYLETRPNVGMVFSDYYHVDENGEILELVKRHNFDEVTVMDQPAHGACTMMRRKWLVDLGGYDESYRCQDGWDIWVRFTDQHEVGNVNLPLFFYRQHGSSLTRNEERILATRSEIIRRFAAGVKEDRNCVAVIPVRGKITDPRSMALRPLGDKTVMDWTICAALEASHIGTVVISTPDEDIIEHVNSIYGDRVAVIKRDWKTAMLNSSPTPSIIEALHEVSKDAGDYDAFAVLFIESPFRSARYLDMAVNTLTAFDTDAVVAVRPETDSFFQHNGQGLSPLRTSPGLRLEKDEMFRQVGDLIVWDRRSFDDNGDMIDNRRIGHIVLGQRAAFRITSEMDLSIASLLAENEDL